MEGRILIVGGTGTLGSAFLHDLAKDPTKSEITILSRDEQKHHKLLGNGYKNVRFAIGDIRDIDSLNDHFYNQDIVIHTAAMKHINMCERFPMESVKTNIIGSWNVATLCERHRIKHCIFSSTDKAVDPISVYGYSKAIAESIFLDANQNSFTNFSVYRWGNILFSNGSALYKFVEDIRMNRTVKLTDLRMTRFFLKIEDAVKFVKFSYKQRSVAPKIIPTLKSAKMVDIVKSIGIILGKNIDIEIIGLRCNEKIHECLMSRHEYNLTEFIDSSHRLMEIDEIIPLIKNEVIEYEKKFFNNWM